MKTDTEGMAESLTIFPGCYATPSTHVHLTAQANITNSSSYSQASVPHIGQLFNKSLLNDAYALGPFSAYTAILSRTTNAENSIYSVANGDGFLSVISVSYLGSVLTD